MNSGCLAVEEEADGLEVSTGLTKDSDCRSEVFTEFDETVSAMCITPVLSVDNALFHQGLVHVIPLFSLLSPQCNQQTRLMSQLPIIRQNLLFSRSAAMLTLGFECRGAVLPGVVAGTLGVLIVGEREYQSPSLLQEPPHE